MTTTTDWTAIRSDEEAAAILRSEHTQTLRHRHLERGTDAFGRDLQRSPEIAAEASRQLVLRESGQTTVHGLLRAMGLHYSGTSSS